VEKVLRSAITNAEMKMPSSKAESFYISKITADEGPMLKRYRAAPMGRATMIRKRTTHILVELDVKEKQQISKHGKR
jgi:large subunit ribosomal protein L22